MDIDIKRKSVGDALRGRGLPRPPRTQHPKC